MYYKLLSNRKLLLSVFFYLLLCIFHQEATAQRVLPTPTGPQLRWQEKELLMFIHFAPNTWTGLSQDDNSLPLSRINPDKLDTDQWCEVAKSFGAKMIVFVAKHSGGFCWWQTNTTEYGVRNIPWMSGKGDLLADLSKSCDKFGLDLGVYIYPGDKTWGAGLGSGGKTKDPSKQEGYNKVFRQQLTEVLTKYKTMKEVWFDGSCGIKIDDILEKHASDAVIFQGPQATIRWVGNERGIAPYPNWYTVSNSDLLTGTSHALHSDPDGDAYAPLEVDVPFLMTPKNHKWFWAPDTEDMILTVPKLMDIYYKSIGRGSVLLLNATPDTTGVIPASHVKIYEAFGNEIQRRFEKPIKSVSGKGEEFIIDLGKPETVNHAVIQEDIAHGQRVRKYVLEGSQKGDWVSIKEGSSIGNRRIEEFSTVNFSKIRLRVTDAAALPIIKNFALYHVGNMPNRKEEPDAWNFSWAVGGWDNQTFGSEWQDFKLDLTPYLMEKVGQFELKFQYISHDREHKDWGLEFEDWEIEMYGNKNSDEVKKIGKETFLINYSQHTTKENTSPVIFRVKIRSKPGKSIGNIELCSIDFK
ncbi:MAG: alpha-L-fucosidase [Anditalea sp.]